MSSINSGFDWQRIVHLLLTSRTIDSIEEKELYPEDSIHYPPNEDVDEMLEEKFDDLLDVEVLETKMPHEPNEPKEPLLGNIVTPIYEED